MKPIQLNYELSHWEALELFCKVVSKFELNTKLNDFKKNEFLVERLEYYASQKNYPRITAEAFQHHNIHLKSFYNIVKKIRRKQQVIISKQELEMYGKYIEDDKFVKREYKKEEFWKPNKKERKLEDTKWLFYYHHDYQEKDVPVSLSEGIAVSILKLKSFGKAEIVGFNESECYEGEFHISGKESDLLTLEMKLQGYDTQSLSLKFYIGSDELIFALGLYQNFYNNISYGTLMIESSLGQPKDLLKPKFYNANEMKILPDYVQKYFKHRHESTFKVPNITSTLDFWKYFGEDNKSI